MHPVRSLAPNGRAFVAIAGGTYYSVDAELATDCDGDNPRRGRAGCCGGGHSSRGKVVFATAHDGLFVLQGHVAQSLRIVPLAIVRTHW